MPCYLHLISKRLPQAFPFHRNWHIDACHFGYWELCPTLDHILPVWRGGTAETNWITTSMVRNAAKAAFTLDELGWSLHPPGKIDDWGRLLGWFIEQARADRLVLDDSICDDGSARLISRALSPCERTLSKPGWFASAGRGCAGRRRWSRQRRVGVQKILIVWTNSDQAQQE